MEDQAEQSAKREAVQAADMGPSPKLLSRLREGDPAAAGELFELLYGDLRSRAHRVMTSSGAETLEPTVLIHEAFLKLSSSSSREGVVDTGHSWRSRRGPCGRWWWTMCGRRTT